MCYRLLKPLLFCLPPEAAHHLTLTALNLAVRFGLLPNKQLQTTLNKTVFNLNFPNPIGLAAGLDKNGDYIDALARLGFGFIEVGTVTPKPQAGNPKPRLFRFPKHQALINRMGFNNKGIDHLLQNVQHMKFKGTLGINIGKNATTPLEEAVQDYLIGFTKAYPYASYITINVSSPNTSGLRDLQHGQFLEQLLSTLKTEQVKLTARHKKYVPLIIKVAPDLTPTEIRDLAKTLKAFHVDGVIVNNTSLERFDIQTTAAGGLSGAPIKHQSVKTLKHFKAELQTEIPIISVGGIMTPTDLQERLEAGASLVQLYTGLIYAGPSLITQSLRTLNENHHNKRHS